MSFNNGDGSFHWTTTVVFAAIASVATLFLDRAVQVSRITALEQIEHSQNEMLSANAKRLDKLEDTLETVRSRQIYNEGLIRELRQAIKLPQDQR